jgi:hypothetical protein
MQSEDFSNEKSHSLPNYLIDDVASLSVEVY